VSRDALPTPLDPITLEVLRNKLDAIAQEMQETLVRSAYSNIVKEGHDASAALFDSRGEMLAQATALPAQLGVMLPAVRRVLRSFPAEAMAEGDVFILNDPYDGGSHLPDIAVVAPVFHAGAAVAIAAAIAHHQDIGGKTPGSLPPDATEIFQEGLRIPLLKLSDRGQLNDTLLALLQRNSRIPDVVMGDLRAQLAALHVGGAGLRGLAEEHGAPRLHAYVDQLLNRAEAMARAALARLRPGASTFRDWLDSDGIDLDRPIAIQATVRAEGSDLHIDFTGSSPQVRGPLNADTSAAMSSVYFVVRALLGPDVPGNGGCYRPVHVHLPPGTVVNPLPPAPVNGRTHTMKRIADVLLGALVPLWPGGIPAAPAGFVRVGIFGGLDPLSGERYVCTDFSTGGTGGQPDRDGVDSLETDIANTMNMPAESLELAYPIRVLQNRLWTDSAGAGRFRGGLGVEREIELLRGEAVVTLREERHRTRAWGLYGGAAAPSCRAEIVRGDGSSEPIPSKGVHTLSAGDRIHCRGAGGAGYGDPLEREPERVLADVLDRKVSPASAFEDYGVVLDPTATAVEPAATAARRAALRSARGPIDWTFDRGDRRE
jgi:N-methylhydantoinase B